MPTGRDSQNSALSPFNTQIFGRELTFRIFENVWCTERQDAQVFGSERKLQQVLHTHTTHTHTHGVYQVVANVTSVHACHGIM